MKKILFATTALVATASVAAADVSFSGYGRFGAIYIEGADATGTPAAIAAAQATAAADAAAAAAAAAAYNAALATGTATAAQALAMANTAGQAATSAAALNAIDGTPDVTGIYTRIRLQIDMTTEADNGLTFGARLRMEDTSVDGVGYGDGGASSGGFNGARFWASAGGLTIGVGNILGAIEAMPGVYMATHSAGMGLTGLGWHNMVTNTAAKGYFNWDAYSSTGTGVDGIEVLYNAGDFAGHISYSENAAGIANVGVNVSYSFNDWKVALGYVDSDNDTRDKVVLTVGGKIGPANVTLGFADNAGTNKVALNGIFEVGAATNVMVFVADEDTAGQDTSYGIAVAHQLGGGASLEAGLVSTPAGLMTADAGIKFNF